MPGKAKIPAPIDRPLSKAYLRQFTGWHTSSPPGLADPTSLQTMENVWTTREGALAVRPALRSVFAVNNWITTNFQARIVGSFESFFLNDGRKALLFAIKQSSGRVSFMVAVESGATYDVVTLSDAGFAGNADEMEFSAATAYVRYLQIDNKIFALPDSSDAADTVRVFYVGTEKKLVQPRTITSPAFTTEHAPILRFPHPDWINDPTKTSMPAVSPLTTGTPDQPLTGTLIDGDQQENRFNFGYFYTFQNELGETPPSQMQVLKTKRGWSQWQFQKAAVGGGPSGESVSDAAMAADQIVVIVPQAAWDDAISDGATAWNVYMVAWSDQGNVPVEGVLVASKDLTQQYVTYGKDAWLQHTPVSASYDISAPLPTGEGLSLTNYSSPSSAAQGLVAGDRIILVNDRQNAAVIRWSSNQLGEYTNFSASKGGGYKTLTSGNLLVPAVVKLWQNPQSTDSLVVLCRGVDGYSTSYYMAPAEVAGQTGTTAIMGFEETTATPGTVSPWGCEVVNQALYHPLDEQLMKSTAANYNISHKSMTESISNVWLELLSKKNIVSSAMDNRIYFVVHNPDGEELEEGCMGNELWVLDVSGPNPVWSRWLIQANSLHKLEVEGKLYMAVVRPDAIFVLDDREVMDQYSRSGETSERAIPWRLQTNTQGANRAHDAWAHLQQVNITTGNFMGRMRYGIRGIDMHGKQVDVSKVTKDLRVVDLHSRPRPWDIEDYLLVRRDLKEWQLYAESVEEQGVPQLSYGQINFVQYRYTPVSVNVGYEYGSIETFEYGRASAPSDPATNYPNGVPAPYVDTSR